MSPASRSKSKEKNTAKESVKALSKPSPATNPGTGVSASAYNPLSGTFHSLETVQTSTTPVVQTNGRFRTIDESEDHVSVSAGTGVDYDSVSNNGSWSGESEDHKEKSASTPVRQDVVPGADNEKREKVRQKNERKHQRQKERKAQELHERCCVYIMSRKLEARVQQLVSMGFSHERATAALMLNEGKLEESIAWLFEGGEDVDKCKEHNLGGGTLKIDIAEELARISDMEVQYKCTKLEVERAVVSSEGDLEKAAESLRTVKLDPVSAQKVEEAGDSPTISDAGGSLGQNYGRVLSNSNSTSMTLVRRDDKDFAYTKAVVPALGTQDSASKVVQPLKRIPTKLDWVKPQQNPMSSDYKWPTSGSNSSVPSSLTPQGSPLPAKADARYASVGGDFKTIFPTVREPVIMMQRPQTINSKLGSSNMSTSPPGVVPSCFPSTSSVETLKPNGSMQHLSSTISPNYGNPSSRQIFQQLQYQQPRDVLPTNRGNGMWSRVGASPTLTAPSSLGLFTAVSATGPSGPPLVDWSTAGTMAQLDYTNIDWSLDRGLSSSPANGFWIGSGSFKHGPQMFDSGVSARLAMRSTVNGHGVAVPGLPDVMSGTETGSSGSREWTSPFEGKDLFSLPRQYVSSPSL